MFTEREIKLSLLLICIQVFASLILFLGLEYFVFGKVLTDIGRIVVSVELLGIWCLLFDKFHLGIIFRNAPFIHLLRGYFVTVIMGCTLFMIEFSLIHPLVYSRVQALNFLFLFAVADLVFLVGFKFIFYQTMLFFRYRGHNSRHVAVLVDKDSTKYIEAFLKQKDWGYKLHYILTNDEELVFKYDKVKVVKDHNSLVKSLALRSIDDFFYCLPVYNTTFQPNVILRACKEIGITSHFLQVYSNNNSDEVQIKNKHPFSHDELSHFVTYRTTTKLYLSAKFKELFDLIFSSLVFVFLSPFLFIISLLIKLEDGGPIFFRQERVGLNGRRFNCLKFRTMVVDAEAKLEELKALNESDGPTFKISDDPRITKIGKLLRKTSLDELPQFYNVIKGEMSIVGPRPPLMSEVMEYERHHIRRLSIKPGITCIWQVSGRNALSFAEWMRLDLEYIDNWSLWLDLKLIYKTVGVVFKGTGM